MTDIANPLAAAAAATAAAPSTSAQATADSARAVSEVQSALVMAQSRPRDQLAATDRILNACTRPTLAEGALYTFNRGGSEVSGPSIRLAEVLAQCWGNMRFGVRELEQVPHGNGQVGHSVVESFAWDLETNVYANKVFEVPHQRDTRRGARNLTEARDIYENNANAGARRLRACILNVIPGDIVEAAVAQCEQTLAAAADTGADTQRAILESFEQHGVTQAQIEAWLGSRLDAIRPAQVVRLRKIAASIRDGMSKPADWFQVAAPKASGKGAGAVAEKLAAKDDKEGSDDA